MLGIILAVIRYAYYENMIAEGYLDDYVNALITVASHPNPHFSSYFELGIVSSVFEGVSEEQINNKTAKRTQPCWFQMGTRSLRRLQ